MNEIHGAGGPSHLSETAAQRSKMGRAAASKDARGAGLSRSTDQANLSGTGRALSILREPSEIRTDLVNRISKEVNDPGYDLDGKFSLALDRLLAEI